MPGFCRFPRLIPAVVAALILLAAGTAMAIPPPVGAPHITEQRNAAVGFAITLWMVAVDALGDHCSGLGSPSDEQFLAALKAWQGRNAPYVNAALEYMADIEDFIKATQGEPARKQFRADRKTEFVASARKAEVVWFPKGRFDEASCQHMANQVASGVMDLDQNAEFFPILQTMKSEVDSGRAP